MLNLRPLPGATVGEGEGQGETRGHRVYLIREALGTRRDPLPLPKFAELIQQTSGVVYDKSTLSRMETGERKVSLEDIEAIAPIDPLKRGKAWLAGWEDGGTETTEASPPPPPQPIIDRVPNGVKVVPPSMFPRVETGDDVRRATGRTRRKRDDRAG